MGCKSCCCNCIDLLLRIILLCTCGYMFYVGFLLPININIHRLRYDALKPIEIYNTKLNWNKYNVETEGITVITYRQKQNTPYFWYIGLLTDTFSNITNENFTMFISHNYTHFIDDNFNDSYTNFLIELSWNEFSNYISQIQNNSQNMQLQIAMYSIKDCINFQQCFTDYMEKEIEDDSIDYIYTPINSTLYVDIDSKSVSIALDNPRDPFICLIFLIASVAYFFSIDGLNIWSKRCKELTISITWIGTYFLWIFTMSLLPIFTGLAFNDSDIQYFGRIQNAMTYYVGNSSWKNGYTFYVFGVILSGIWAYFVFLYYPFTSLMLTVVRFCVGHNKKLTKQCIHIIMMPMNVGAFLIMFLISMGFVSVFIGVFVLYNPNTYHGLVDNIWAIQGFYGLVNIFVVIPMLACIMQMLPKKKDKNDRVYDGKSFESVLTNEKDRNMSYMQVSNDQHIEEVEYEQKEIETVPINGYNGQNDE